MPKLSGTCRLCRRGAVWSNPVSEGKKPKIFGFLTDIRDKNQSEKGESAQLGRNYRQYSKYTPINVNVGKTRLAFKARESDLTKEIWFFQL